METAKSAFDLVLDRLLLLALTLFCCAGAWLLWRISCTVQHTDAVVQEISAELQKVSHTAGNLAKDVDRLRDDVKKQAKKLREALPTEKAKALRDAAAPLHAQSGTKAELSEKGAREIDYLLDCVKNHPREFVSGDSRRSAERMLLSLKAKKAAYSANIASAEDFIKLCADKSVTGGAYVVIVDDAGKQTPLGDWLSAKLAAYRSKALLPKK